MMKAKNQRRMTSFRFSDATFEILEQACNATGMTMTEVIERCLRGHLTSLLAEVTREREEAASQLEDYFDSMDTEEQLEKHMAKKGKKVGKRSRVDVDALKLAQHAANEVKKKRKKG